MPRDQRKCVGPFQHPRHPAFAVFGHETHRPAGVSNTGLFNDLEALRAAFSYRLKNLLTMAGSQALDACRQCPNALTGDLSPNFSIKNSAVARAAAMRPWACAGSEIQTRTNKPDITTSQKIAFMFTSSGPQARGERLRSRGSLRFVSMERLLLTGPGFPTGERPVPAPGRLISHLDRRGIYGCSGVSTSLTKASRRIRDCNSCIRCIWKRRPSAPLCSIRSASWRHRAWFSGWGFSDSCCRNRL